MQADLNLNCAHMSEGTIFDVPARIILMMRVESECVFTLILPYICILFAMNSNAKQQERILY